MEKLVHQIAQDSVWNKWVAANSAETDGCISGTKEGCISSAKAGCISIARTTALPKTGCIS